MFRPSARAISPTPHQIEFDLISPSTTILSDSARVIGSVDRFTQPSRMKAAGPQSLSATATPSTLSGSGASSFSSTFLGPRHASIAHLSPPKLQPQAPGQLQPPRVAAVPFSASARRTTSDSSFSSGAFDAQRQLFDPSQLPRPASSSQLRALQVALPDSRAKLLWAKVRSKVVRGSDFTELLRTLRALHNISLTFVNSYDGFTAPSKAIDFICRHSLTPSFAPFWLDAHCLSEDEARRIQRAFGFHSKTYSLLFSHSHGHNSLKYERETCSWFVRRGSQRSRTEAYVTININVPCSIAPDQRKFDVPFVIVCCSDCVITSCWEFNNPVVEEIRMYMHKCITAIQPLNPGVDMIFGVVLRCISDLYLNVCDAAQAEVDYINQQRGGGGMKFTAAQTKLRLQNLAAVVEQCTYLKRSLDPKALMLQTFITRVMPSYLESSSDDIKDSAQLFVGLSSRVQDFITHLDSVQANYLAMINLQVSEQSHAVNLLMEKLQVVSCVFLPLTLASGIMGMNVPIPGSEINDGDDTYFWCLLGAFALVAIVSTYFLMHSRAPVLASDATELPADDAGDTGAAARLRSRKASLAIVGGKVSGV